jgi:hypothetical protein
MVAWDYLPLRLAFRTITFALMSKASPTKSATGTRVLSATE